MEQTVSVSQTAIPQGKFAANPGSIPVADRVLRIWGSALPTLPEPEALRPEAVTRRDPLSLALWLQGAEPGALKQGFRGVALVNQLRQQEIAPVNGSLQKRLNRLPAPARKGLGSDFWARVALIDQLVEHLCATPALNEKGRRWFRRLDSTLLLYLLLAPECLVTTTHPLCQSLDYLGYLGVGDRGQGSAWAEHLEWRVDSLSQGRSGYSELCETAAFLQECKADCEARYERQVRRVVAAAEGANKLARAHSLVDQALDKRIPTGKVPSLVNELLRAGWRDLLVLTFLRNHELDKGYLALMYALLSATQGRALAEMQVRRFKHMLEQGFAVIGDGGVPAALSERIEQCLRIGADPEASHLPGAHEPLAAAAGDMAAEEPVCPQVAAWLQGVQRLSVGAWLFGASNPAAGPLRLAWTNANRDRFVFVTAQGRKACELSQLELADKLARKHWMADPAWYRASLLTHGLMHLVQDLYSRLAPQALEQLDLARPRYEPVPAEVLNSAQPILQSRRLIPLHGLTRMGSREEAIFSIPDEAGRLRDVAELISQPAGEEWWRSRGITGGLMEKLRRCDVGFTVPVGIGIPVPGQALEDSHILEAIFSRLSVSQVPMEHLWFDVRAVSSAQLSAVAAFIREVRGLGCRVCLSETGSPEKLPELLRQLPADMIRLDGRLADDSRGRWVLEATTCLAHLFGCEVMAEHVDDKAWLALLPELGIDYAQGDAVGKPKLLR